MLFQKILIHTLYVLIILTFHAVSVKSCEPGYWKRNNICNPCWFGKYSDSTTNTCIDCAVGKWSDQPARVSESDCVLCSAGKYSKFPGAVSESSCLDCVAGTYSELVGASNVSLCLECEVGTYSDRIGSSLASNCISCGEGFDTKTRGATSEFECACPLGYFEETSRKNVSETTPCVENEFFDAWFKKFTPCSDMKRHGIHECFQTWNNGLQLFGDPFYGVCVSCPCICKPNKLCAGVIQLYNQNNPFVSKCLKCPVGKYKDTRGSADCKDCQKGKYSSTIAADHPGVCQQCPPKILRKRRRFVHPMSSWKD